MVGVNIIEEESKLYAKTYLKSKPERFIHIPLMTKNKTLIDARVKTIKKRGLYFLTSIYSDEKYHIRSFVGSYFEWVTKIKEVKIPENKMDELELKKRRDRHRKDPRVRLRENARGRAIKKNLDFDLYSYKDLPLAPNKCPYLKIKLIVGDRIPTNNSPSLDRIDNSKGYVKNNVQIISRKANQIKNNASFEEFEMIYLHWKKQREERKWAN